MVVSDVYRTLWRNRLFVLLITAIVVASAFVLTSRQTKLYTASSLVRVQQTVQNEEEVFGALLTGERLARTYEHIVETSSVGDLVRDELRGRVPTRSFAIGATQLSNLELLRISVTDPDPRVAEVAANTVPVVLGRFIARTGTFRDTITVVERASEPTVPSSPNLRLNIVIAVMLGLILGGALAVLKESVADRIGSIEELEKSARHPVIAVIPNLKFAPIVRESRLRSRQKRSAEAAAATAQVRSIETAEGSAKSRWSVRG
jgi:polysaccharide biosynthesis transport protein